jgi:hypothetical protein
LFPRGPIVTVEGKANELEPGKGYFDSVYIVRDEEYWTKRYVTEAELVPLENQDETED